jgi:uncharacterized protein YjbI with pentapeptide repeats
MTNPTSKKSQRVRFEEVTPTNEIVAYFNAQLPSLVAGTGLPIFPGYDDLDDIQFAYITLPSGNTVVLGQYENAPEIGVDLYVELDCKHNSTEISTNIAALVVETLRYLAIPKETAVWFHPDYETEIERIYSQDGAFESISKISTEQLTLTTEYEPIDCLYYALGIYARPKFPKHWAMLQHNLGLAYFDRSKGERLENLQNSVQCFNKSLEVFTENEFPGKWGINQEDLTKSQQLIKQILVKDILDRPIPYRKLRYADLRGADLSGADLRGADLRCASLDFANLDRTNFGSANLPNRWLITNIKTGRSKPIVFRVGISSERANKGANLSEANFSNSSLRGANLRGTNLRGTNLIGADVRGANFGDNLGISKSMKQDLIDRGAIFDDAPPGDRSESRTLVPR